MFANDDVAQSLVRRAIFVCGGGRWRKPALVDAAAIESESIKIIRMEFEAFAGVEKRARDPARRQAEEAAAFVQGGFDERSDIAFDSLELGDGVHCADEITGFASGVKPGASEFTV